MTCAQLVNYPDSAAPTSPQPEVAKSVDISADRLTYTFKLRGGYRFSPPSNAPVTADAFKRALERVRDPALASPGAAYFSDVVSITSDGDKRLAIRLARPAGDFLARLATPFGCAVPPDTPMSAQFKPIPSAGPYYISAFTPGSRLVLSRNPNYDGSAAGEPRPDSLPAERRAVAVAAAGRGWYGGLRRGRAADGGLRAGRPGFPDAVLCQPDRKFAVHRAQHEPAAFLDTGGAAGRQSRARPGGPDRDLRRVRRESL